MTVCAHFGLCGGCSLQNLAPADYRSHKRALVSEALARAGLGDVVVAEPVIVADQSRRRAVFKLARSKDGLEIGFHAQRSHSIVDMRECLVLSPALLRLTVTLRRALTDIMQGGEKAELHVTEADNGLDLAFRWERKLNPALTSAIAKAFAGSDVIRVILNKDVVTETATPIITLGGARVALPPQAFLQATREGETALQAHVLNLVGKSKHVLDLFAGLGTFALPLAARAKVHAVEQDGVALNALAAAARGTSGLRPVTTEMRDLFKQPLSGAELKPYDAVVLDPPRAGAQAQVAALGGSAIARIVYVSCDAASFARDAVLLTQAGFTPGTVTPIDQFLYSGHIELVAGFERSRRR